MKLLLFAQLLALVCHSSGSPLIESNFIYMGLENATLNQKVNVAYYNLWAFDSNVQLPITESNLVNFDNIKWTVRATNSNTKTPVWNRTFPILAKYFDGQAFLAIEIYNEATTSTATYVGGKIFTSVQMKQLPHFYRFDLLDKEGNRAGVAEGSWN